jgi:hypothetical protein
MRDSASPAPLIFPNSADTSRGTNQSGVKLYNKSLVLSLVRRYGSLSKTEIGRRTGLSTQTSSVIMKQLEDDGLLIRKEPMRGKVGQPSIPMSLNPEGAFSIGFKFGRRSAELVLARLVWRRYINRLARGLSLVVNALDPDVLVIGGGMSNVDELYTDLPLELAQYTFSTVFETPIRKALHGDSSGVRGAAWLWKEN